MMIMDSITMEIVLTIIITGTTTMMDMIMFITVSFMIIRIIVSMLIMSEHD